TPTDEVGLFFLALRFLRFCRCFHASRLSLFLHYDIFLGRINMHRVSVVSAFIGAPVLIFLVRRKSNGGGL
ncbi:hypothetical protein MJI95_35520, partial [Salmonella enterica subsp. enterica serovar Kentucky]|nr:hypothetical protein [Salmonella enterica subsp. enterica serovar Kentucky]